MNRLPRLAACIVLVLTGLSLSACASKTSKKEDKATKKNYVLVDTVGSRIRKKVYVGEGANESTSPVSSIGSRDLNTMMNSTRSGSSIGTP